MQSFKRLNSCCSLCKRVRMFVAGYVLCLFYFSPAVGHAAWLKGGRAALTQGNRTFCHLVASDHSFRSLSFLARLGGLRGGLVLFQTLWSRQGDLEQCTVREEPSVTRTYLTFCTEHGHKPGTAGSFLTEAEPRPQRDLRVLQQRAATWCSSPAAAPSPAAPALLRPRRRSGPAGVSAWFPRQRGRGARRSRRGWTFPGTIWCGAGDSAENFTDLGIFNQTDFCCREHDHCEHKIYAFEYNYGMLNLRLHTISHCDCDYRFKKCLQDVNNTISTLVGITFFSIFQVPCFNLKPVEHCVKKTWLSSCQVTKLVPQAILHHPSKYTYTQPTVDDVEMGLWPAASSPATTSGVNQTASSVSIGFVYPSSQLDTTQKAQRKNKKKCKKCSGHQKQESKAPSQNILKTRADSSRTCNCYKPLDQCEHKILPQEFKFAYYNQEPKTVYHCDCTRRLANRMKREVNVNMIKELFFEFVSLNCFRLKSVTKNCSKEEVVLCENQSSSRVAILSKPRYLQRILKVWRIAEESPYPLPDEQERKKNGTFNSTNSAKLYDKCLQMIRAFTVKA